MHGYLNQNSPNVNCEIILGKKNERNKLKQKVNIKQNRRKGADDFENDNDCRIFSCMNGIFTAGRDE